MHASDLHVVAVISNPARFASRTRLFGEFVERMRSAGVDLIVVEAAFGDRPFLVTEAGNPHHVQVRHWTELWNKECQMRIGVEHLTRVFPGWRNLATIDADIEFLRDDWATETIEALQHYDVIQPWSDCYDSGPYGEHVQHHRSFCRNHVEGKPIPPGPYDPFAHPGYAWAWTRRAYEALGGFIEIGACGAGDHHMALGLIGKAELSMPGGISAAYRREVMGWQARALQHVQGNIGFIKGAIRHFHHGPKAKRFYQDRWQILVGEGYDPDTDLKRNAYGMLELAGNKPGLRDKLRAYFRSRDEDSREV